MLPFLKRKNEAGAAASAPVQKREHDETFEYGSDEMIGEDLCRAIESKNYKDIAEILKSAFQIFDSEPHEEGSHE